MINFYSIILSVFLLALSGCASVTKDIEIDAAADPTIKFSGYNSYAWLGQIEGLNDPDGVWQPPKMDIAEDVRFLIDRELRKRGLFNHAESPDLLVAVFMGVDMQAIEIKVDPNSKLDILQNMPTAALAIALIDNKTGYTVWVSEAMADVQQNRTEEVIRERLDYAVSQMFKKLPRD